MNDWKYLCLMILCLSAAGRADERVDENAMFGATPSAGTEKKDAFATGEVQDNALTVGGLYYQRVIASASENKSLGRTPLSAPMQFDGFLDARPSDRVRGYVGARLFYDATKSSTSAGNFQFSSISTAPTTTTASNPLVVLDQAWLKFDIVRTVFVTAGKQHVKWGASRFWNPTDFLHTQRRDPLSPYDLRLGNAMVKFAVPLESHKASLYAVALLDNPQPAVNLGQLGGAFRAEAVLGSAEVGIEAITRGGVRPVYGADLSTPLGPFDFYVEGGCLTGPTTFYSVNTAGLTPGADVSTIVTSTTRQGPFFQVSGGINYQFAWKDNRLATIGVEYFFNELGHTDAHAYPALIYFGQFQPFYVGRHYAAVYLTAEGPDAEKRTNFTLSTLSNLSDASVISRLDFSWRVLTYLTFESFVAFHYGTRGGEFRFAQSTPALVYQGNSVPAIEVAATTVDIGVGLRLAF